MTSAAAAWCFPELPCPAGLPERGVRSVLMVDVDGVLLNGRPRDGAHLFSDLEAELGINLERLQAEFFEPHWEAVVTGRANMMDRLRPVLARLAPELPAERFVEYWFENDSRIESGVLDGLRALRETSASPRIYLATNQEHMRARYLMDTLDLAAHVDGIVYSAALGHRKPGAAFFRLAAERTERDRMRSPLLMMRRAMSKQRERQAGRQPYGPAWETSPNSPGPSSGTSRRPQQGLATPRRTWRGRSPLPDNAGGSRRRPSPPRSSGGWPDLVAFPSARRRS